MYSVSSSSKLLSMLTLTALSEPDPTDCKCQGHCCRYWPLRNAI